MEKLIVIGAGGLGQEVIWAARRMNAERPTFELLGLCDDDVAKKGLSLEGYPVLGTPEAVAATGAGPIVFVCGIGTNAAREVVVARACALGWTPGVVVDPSVVVASGTAVGPGTYVGAGSILSPNARIGAHVIVNHHCSIGHDSRLEDFVQVSPGCRVSGWSVVARGAFLGSNAVVAPKRRVGRNAVLAAGSFAMRDVPDDVTAIGVPARATIRREA